MKARKQAKAHRSLKTKRRKVAIMGARKRPPRIADRRAPTRALHQETHQETRRLADIKVGKRHRRDYGDLASLARSIDARGALLQPIVITEHDELIAGERRMRAWRLSKFKDSPIPVHVVSIDAIIAGEWDENALRKDFTPTEQVAIRDEIEKRLKVLAAARQRAGTAADPASKGNAADQAARYAGKDRRTLDKAKAIVEAARANPKDRRFQKLREDMDRTGRVNGPYQRLKVIEQTEAISNAPPVAAFEGKRKVVVIDYPWPNEPGMSQAELDAAGRSLRPYPAMAIEQGCRFMKRQVAPLLDDDCVIWFWTTNYHLINGHAGKLLHALGFDERSTLLTWDKDLLGRGQILREVTEQCIVAFRGRPVINVLGEDPPTTLIREKRRENSRKPDAFYRLVERVTPAARYASIFSRGGEGDRWDCHGDEVGKYAIAPRGGEAAGGCAPGVTPPKPVAAARPSLGDKTADLLAAVEAGEAIAKSDAKAIAALITSTKKGYRLTAHGKNELAQAREEFEETERRKRAMAELPESLDDLIEHYRSTVARHHDAVLAGDKEAVIAETLRLDLIEDKANGGTSFGKATSKKVQKLFDAAWAPVGQVPRWRESGVFALTVAGMPLIVTYDGTEMDWSIAAVDPDRPFISETGYRRCNFMFEDRWIKTLRDWVALPPATTVDAVIRQELADELAGKHETGKAKGKPIKLHAPEEVHRLPRDWSELRHRYEAPPVISKKAARAAIARAKADAEQDQANALDPVDEGEPPPARAGRARPVPHSPSKTGVNAPAPEEGKVEGPFCVVCNLRPVKDDPHGAAFCDTCAALIGDGHVVSMRSAGGGSSLAVCPCGWRHEAPRDGLDGARRQDAAVHAHWKAVAQAARDRATATAGEQLELSPFLDRRNDKSAAEAAE